MLKNRLLSIGVMLFICGCAISVCSDGIVFPLCFAALTVSCSLLCAIRFLRLRTSLIFGLIPLAAFLWVSLYSFLFIPHENVKGSAYAVVTDEASYYSGRRLTVSVTSSDVIGKGTDVMIWSPPDREIDFGDIVYLEGSFACLDDSPSYLASRTYYSFHGDAYYVDKSGDPFILLRKSLTEKCDRYLGNFSPTVKAITIADKSGITSSDYRKYSASGVSHVLAVSGLHLTIAVMAIYSLFRRRIGNRYIVCLSGCAVVFVFLLVSAFPISSVRAGIMLCLMFIANMIAEKRDSLTSLFASAGIILLADPFAVMSLSLQLSFLATLGILSVSNAVKTLHRPSSGIKKILYEYTVVPVRFLLSSLVFTFPVTLTSFGTVSVISPVSAIIVSLIFPFYLSISYIFCFVSLILPFAAKPISYVVIFFADIFDKIIDFLSSFRYSAVSTDGVTGIILLVVSLVCISAMLVIRKKYFVILFYASVGIMTLTVALHVFVTSLPKDKVYFYNGNNGYAVVALSDGECVYVDDGAGASFDSLITRAGSMMCGKAVLRSLDESSVSKARYLMECMGTEEIYLLSYGESDEVSYLNAILHLANANGCDIIYESYHAVKVGGIVIEVTPSATGINYGNDFICIADGDISYEAAFFERIVLPSCIGEPPEPYEKAETYGVNSFTDLLE